ncbi:MAG: hypothetical protein AAFS10_24240, partial [Myxococcota bacterium]
LEGPLAQALNARKKDTRMGAAGLLLEIPVTEATQALAATRAAKEKVAGVKQLLEQVLEAPLAAEGADEDTEVDQSPLEGFRAALDAEWVTQTHDALEGYTKTLADNERYLYQDNEQEPFRDFLLGLPGEPLAVAVVAADWMKNTGGYFPFMGLEALLERVVDRPEAPWLALEAWFGVYTADDEQSLERLKALFGAERLTAPTRIWATTEENSVELLHRMMVTHLPEVIAPIWVGQLKDRSKYAREHAEQLLAEAAEATTPFVITFLKDRQATIRQRAADWLAKHGGSHAREGLAKALKREKNKKARKAIVVALAAVTPIDVILEGATADTDAALDAVLSSSPSAAEDAPAGVDAQALTDLLWASGIPLSAGAQRWLLVGLSHENQDHSNTNLWRIRLRLDATHAEAAAETLMANLGTSNEARALGIYAQAVLGSEDRMETFGEPLDDLARNSASTWAFHRLAALARRSSPVALYWLDTWAGAARSKGLRARAEAAVTECARAQDVSPDVLMQRARPPRHGFNAQATRQVQAGGQTLTLRLAPSGVTAEDASGKAISWRSMSRKVGKGPAGELKALREAIDRSLLLVVATMERAMVADQRWPRAAWHELFIH